MTPHHGLPFWVLYRTAYLVFSPLPGMAVCYSDPEYRKYTPPLLSGKPPQLDCIENTTCKHQSRGNIWFKGNGSLTSFI
jgi:hypothetical protein